MYSLGHGGGGGGGVLASVEGRTVTLKHPLEIA